ncbi:HK97 family phage prohead protease [Aureimonas sp. AU12]|uniref:HK97 family phage prohead protease n=1 Tax=Aureimonas sp. AU12 TaxID=1638161 RepID=UPI000785A8B9|nr:HK97 family phage prohead protease [Aureimonas sp. AU12]
MDGSNFVAPLELKFASEGVGEFEGYGAIFGNIDSHGDLIAPGAFAASLAQHKAKGTMPAMFVQHGPALGGDSLPSGVWQEVEEDSRGLKVKGKISALDTDHGRRLRGLMQDGAMRGLSIGYRVAPGGAATGRKAGQPRRTLNTLDLVEISIVRDPSNIEAQVSGIKSESDPLRASTAIAAAMRLHDKSMGENYAYSSPRDKALLMNHLRDAHEALTGTRAPTDLDGWKEIPTVREIERMLREEFSLSRSEASAVAERRFKSVPRDEGGETKSEDTSALRSVLDGFKLPSFS